MASFTIPPTASPEHFFGVLASVDWYYGFSDSASVFRAGAETANAIEAFAKRKGGMYMRMYADRIAYVSKVTSGHAAQAREPQLKDYIRSDVPIPTIASVRHASKEEISTYLSLRIDDNVAVGKELANGEVYGEEGMKMVRLFLENHIYDPAITRVIRVRDMVVYVPTKGQPGACYVTKEARSRIDVFRSPAHFRAYFLKYYYN